MLESAREQLLVDVATVTTDCRCCLVVVVSRGEEEQLVGPFVVERVLEDEGHLFGRGEQLVVAHERARVEPGGQVATHRLVARIAEQHVDEHRAARRVQRNLFVDVGDGG